MKDYSSTGEMTGDRISSVAIFLSQLTKRRPISTEEGGILSIFTKGETVHERKKLLRVGCAWRNDLSKGTRSSVLLVFIATCERTCRISVQESTRKRDYSRAQKLAEGAEARSSLAEASAKKGGGNQFGKKRAGSALPHNKKERRRIVRT